MQQPSPGMPPAVDAAPAAQYTGMLSPDGVWRWDGVRWIPANLPQLRPYRPAGSRRPWTIAGLVLAGLAELVLLGALVGRLDLVNRIGGGEAVGLAEAQRSDDTVRIAGFIVLGTVAVCAVVFLRWLHRVVANNHALGARALRFSPGQAVGWWFVPVANWVLTFRVMAETWRASDPARPHSTPDQRTGAPLSPLLVGWWLALAFSSLLTVIANSSYRSSTGDLDTLRTATLLSMAGSGLLVVAALLGAVVVSQLTERQRAQQLAMAAAPAIA